MQKDQGTVLLAEANQMATAITARKGYEFHDLRPVLEFLIAGDFTRHWLRGRVTQLQRQPAWQNPGGEGELLICSQGEFNLSLKMTGLARSRRGDLLPGNVVDYFMHNPTGSPQSYDEYLEDHSPGNRRLIPLGKGELESGGVRLIRAGESIIDFRRMERGPGMNLILFSATRRHHTTVWDPVTGRARFTASSIPAHSRISLTLRILAEAGLPESAPVLEKLFATHPAREVRWGALRAMTDVSPGRLPAMLRQAVRSDPHPHIRNAARKSLENMRRQS